MAAKWRCNKCGAMTDVGRGFCSNCYADKPKATRTIRVGSKAGSINFPHGTADRLRAGDTILGGYVMDKDLKPVRRYVK